MCWSSFANKRSRSECMKRFSKHELQALFVGLTCAITLFMFCSEHYFNNQSIRFSDIQSRQPRINRSIYQSMRDWILGEKNLANVKNRDIARNSSTFFFNSSETFRKLFETWLNSSSTKAVPDVSFTTYEVHPCVASGRNLSLVIAVTSSASHLESRAAIRETWGGFAKERGAKLIFFIGIPKNAKYHPRIASEDVQHHDIVQGDFLDTYFNLSIKSLSVLRWVRESCPLVKFVLKVDDDMFINVKSFLNISSEMNVSKSILGELAHEWPPVRSPKNKWFTSLSDYPFNIYPDFVFGPSYLLTGDSVGPLYDTSRVIRFFHLEDVYVTGFVAERAGVRRRNLPHMFNIPKDLQPCSFQKLLSSHGHTPPDIRRHWMWLNRRSFKCLSPDIS